MNLESRPNALRYLFSLVWALLLVGCTLQIGGAPVETVTIIYTATPVRSSQAPVASSSDNIESVIISAKALSQDVFYNNTTCGLTTVTIEVQTSDNAAIDSVRECFLSQFVANLSIRRMLAM